ncbi:response regulator transcription factor [Beijerinckia sp. L45]|uniref:response regulator transcription factor n=1 Tax=Beijerinckia sp. L45 TaxID=1641855 RepID=UPI00131AB5D3|nr:response regulator [Beijerinckia sp. L45]
MVSVVLVEDDKAVREALRFSLAIEGFDILAYDSAEAFLRDDHALLSQCLVVDQQMPGMTGIDLVAALRKRECLIPSILITTWPRQALRMRAFQAGCRAILEKPLKGNVLSDCIHAAIREARSRPA